MFSSLVIAFALWFSTPSHAAMAALSCDSPYAQSESECEGLKSWTPEHFTPPEKLEDSGITQFTLLHHSICGFDSIDPGSKKPWRTLLLEDPTRLVGNPRVSASLISESHKKVWYPGVGFILSVQPENVVATRESDAGSPSLRGYTEATERSLREYSAIPNWADIRSPREILNLSRNYNEIVLRGKGYKTESPIRVTGIIIHCVGARGFQRIDRDSEDLFKLKVLASKCQLQPEAMNALLRLRTQLPIFCYELKSPGDPN